MDQAISAAAALMFLVLALVQVAKMMGLPSKLAPLASIGIGVVSAFLVAASDKVDDLDTNNDTNIWLTVLTGVVAGLMACGLWSGAKAVGEAVG